MSVQRTDELSYPFKDPKPPMPKLCPDLLTEQNVVGVAAYLHEELER